ncbi:hypothetical protein [Hyphomonas sp.]|uniref:hypothetical protein n=1 Tax=Hyphomonas sp. TaxID=87 RepID=UPI003242E92F
MRDQALLPGAVQGRTSGRHDAIDVVGAEPLFQKAGHEAIEGGRLGRVIDALLPEMIEPFSQLNSGRFMARQVHRVFFIIDADDGREGDRIERRVVGKVVAREPVLQSSFRFCKV